MVEAIVHFDWPQIREAMYARRFDVAVLYGLHQSFLEDLARAGCSFIKKRGREVWGFPQSMIVDRDPDVIDTVQSAARKWALNDYLWVEPRYKSVQ